MRPNQPASTSPPQLLLQFVRGFCMGVADIVPGVSGGTIALIMGIYRRLVDNIHRGAKAIGRSVKGDFTGAGTELKEVDWAFLIPLLVGIGAAFGALSHLIEDLLADHPEPMAGLFLGLVAASVVIAAKMVESWDAIDYSLLAIVTIGAFILLGYQSGAISSPSAWQFLGAGAVAICAMILPGISGSFILLMLGMYAGVLGALNDRELGDLAVFIVGAIIGLALFSTLLNWLLAEHQDKVLASLIGLMIGSVRVLWPWPNGVGIISDNEDEVVKGTGLDWPNGFESFLWPTVLGIGAFFVVWMIAVVGERRTAPTAARQSVGN